MKIFVDTADVDQIREVSAWGIIDGCTTNPSLVAKSGRDLKDVINEITSIVDGPISAEVAEGKAEEMVEEGKIYAAMHKNIVIKLPMTIEGVKATKMLSALGIKTNVTLVFTIAQALIAAKAGATYVSPFMGRLDDYVDSEEAGYILLQQIKQVFTTYGYKTQIIAASIRTVEHFEQAALAGSDIATVPHSVLVQLDAHQLTTRGLEIFAKDSKK